MSVDCYLIGETAEKCLHKNESALFLVFFSQILNGLRNFEGQKNNKIKLKSKK